MKDLLRPVWPSQAVTAIGALALGFGLLTHRPAAAGPDAAPPDPAGALIVQAIDTAPNRGAEPFLGLVAVDPVTAGWRPIFRGPAGIEASVAPDGRSLVYSSFQYSTPDRNGIWVHDLTGRAPERRIFEHPGQVYWVDKGRRVVIGRWHPGNGETVETWRVDADGSGRTRLPIPESDLVLDASADGNWLATRTIGGDPRHHGRLTVVHPDGTSPRHLTEGSPNDDVFSIFKIAPDGKSVAYVEITTVDRIRYAKLFIVDIDGKHRRRVPTHFEPGTTVTVLWSPDGSRLALNLIGSGGKKDSILLVEFHGANYRFRKLPLPPTWANLMLLDWKPIAPDVRVAPAEAGGRR